MERSHTISPILIEASTLEWDSSGSPRCERSSVMLNRSFGLVEAQKTREYSMIRKVFSRDWLSGGREPSRRGLIENLLWEAYHNIVEYSGKLRNGWICRDEYLTRYSASIIAVHVERALVALNDISIVSENYLWHQILT